MVQRHLSCKRHKHSLPPNRRGQASACCPARADRKRRLFVAPGARARRCLRCGPARCPGHGGSSAPENGYLYSDLADDVLGLIEELELNAPTLVGHSMGGMTAALVASELGSATKAVVLIDPTFISPEWQREVYESNVAAEHQQLLQSTRDDLLTQARLRSPNRSAEMIEYMVDARLHTSLSAFEVLTPPNPDWRKLMQNIGAPILLLIGDRGIVSLETACELQGINPPLRYELIPDAGHGLPYDEPEKLGAAVSAFLAEVAAIGSGTKSME
ncbi:alpha/beta fold hydrolase [Pseudaminobacter soli (ex Li et al. 2025)]|uniref:alpha/beta fold hydrolase n=1 Tax=Pseudaminobacter soli (ex Li et al. 2025) TaxID=1295366 RepID=UPI001FE170CD|nr:alpha/beta fold hydrolase [Mesorhizobium soli]